MALTTVCKPAEPHYSAFQQFDHSNITVQVGTNRGLLQSPSTPNQEDAPSHKTDEILSPLCTDV